MDVGVAEGFGAMEAAEDVGFGVDGGDGVVGAGESEAGWIG